ncbi:Lon protease family protein [Antarcticimicrobium luteum]|uniref:endopeptidase La n=1 Tax=Antarcticimicrobium luteum TaxID=2547397 RepID=A0A4R5VCK8_9RHOB|nr:AAA family ATPase [Antarcticimicrobium luteum]TDK50023.1 peptidase [Antarcticimicrobium luteum]
MTDHAQTDPGQPIAANRLRPACDPASLGFATTAELEPIEGLIGQDRAMEAIRLAAGMRASDFNLFVQGPPGTGRRASVDAFLGRHAATLPEPDDWAYVNNFDAPHRPRALRLPPGVASKLKDEMEDVVDDLAIDIAALFESDDYQAANRAINEEFGEQQEHAMSEFAEKAKSENVALMRTPMGIMLAAIKDGEVVKTDHFETLPEDEQKQIEEKIGRLQAELSEILRNAPKLDRDRRRRIEALNAEMLGEVVASRLREARDAFAGLDAVQAYLATVEEDLIGNAEMFLVVMQQQQQADGPFPESVHKAHSNPVFQRYMVNVMVTREEDDAHGAPLESEDLPTLDRLTGRIEHAQQMGALFTNFMMIKPGALHRANGGYLVLDARRLLSEPMAWPALKQCLQSESITITSMGERLSLVSTTSLEPDPIPMNLRVVLIGDRMLYALLVTLDPDFGELFKLQADFEESIERSDESQALFARVIGMRATKDGLHPVSAAGVARLMDEAVRLAEDASKLSLHLGALGDLLREADYYAGQNRRDQIEAADVDMAVRQADRRAARIKDRMREMVRRKTILIDTGGARVGQVNGLSVIGLGGYRFGRPSRITARTRMGGGELIDIEREVELGGPLHSKGVLILSGYLSATYALDVPYSLQASLVFEQSYGGVDGDSASAAELFALISSLSGLPIDQGFGVTGSVNQNGEIQAIGGVNEKIEGFFETCLDQGLTGAQGVMIPAANVDHLMLRQDVVDAVRDGTFRVIAIRTIDEGLAVLTGRDPGTRGADGVYPPDSVNGLAEARLRGFADQRLKFAQAGNKPPNGQGG